MQMNYYPKILPFYMTYPMPLIWEEEDTVMRDLEYLQELYPRQAKKYRKRIEELLERFDSEGSVLYDEYPDRMTLYKMAQDIYAVLEQEEKREQAEAAAVAAAPADGGEVSTTGGSISAGAAMNPAVRTAEAAAPLGPESMDHLPSAQFLRCE